MKTFLLVTLIVSLPLSSFLLYLMDKTKSSRLQRFLKILGNVTLVAFAAVVIIGAINLGMVRSAQRECYETRGESCERGGLFK